MILVGCTRILDGGGRGFPDWGGFFFEKFFPHFQLVMRQARLLFSENIPIFPGHVKNLVWLHYVRCFISIREGKDVFRCLGKGGYIKSTKVSMKRLKMFETFFLVQKFRIKPTGFNTSPRFGPEIRGGIFRQRHCILLIPSARRPDDYKEWMEPSSRRLGLE